MTELVNPSINRVASAEETAGAIAYAGGTSDNGGYVQPATDPSRIAEASIEVDDTALNEFVTTTSASSFDITVDPGEAFIYGAWVVKDTATTVTVPASTTGHTVYVGWDISQTNDVIIGGSSAFAANDPKIPLFSVDTDGSGVTSETTLRRLTKHVTFGDKGDMDIRYDDTAEDIRWRDGTNDVDRMALDRTTGDLSISGQFIEGVTF